MYLFGLTCSTILQLRDRPTWRRGLWFFVSFRIFLSDNTRVRIFFFGRAKRVIFFPEFNIRLYDKNSESYYFFFSSTKIKIFFSATLGIRIFFLEKTIPPPAFQVKWSFPNGIMLDIFRCLASFYMKLYFQNYLLFLDIFIYVFLKYRWSLPCNVYVHIPDINHRHKVIYQIH